MVPADESADLVVLSDPERIGRIRAEFELKWLSGEAPRIEEFLLDTREPLRSTLLVELVKLEVECRRRKGESPRIDDYARRFPEYAGQLLDSWDRDPERTAPYRRTAGSFAHFELREFLGRGSYGDVWMAFDQKLERIVALKIPRREILDQQGAEVFRREARAAAQLRHPNIVRLYEVDEQGETTSIVSEYIEGITLKDDLHARRPQVPSPRQSAELVAKVADALQHAHSRGIVHRDLKPANILLDRQGEPHITDFGLAKRTASDASLTADGLRLGTVPYMSPEQACGDSNRVDGRSDVFSLGVILYEMLTGERPFRGEEHVVIHRILTEEPEPPRRTRKEVPRDLESICLKALEKDRERRYASAGEFAEDLRRYLRGAAVQARPIRLAGRVLRRVRRAPGLTALAALVVLFAGLAGVFALGGLGRDPAAVAQTAPAEPRPVKLATIPAGATVVFVPISDRDGKPQADGLIAAARSPVRLDLAPGDYWVVADIPGYGFHEVRRHVPGDGVATDRWYRQRNWSMEESVVVLPTIEIPDSSVLTGMAQFSGSSRFITGSGADPRRQTRKVRDFFLDPTEVTVAAYKQFHKGAIPRVMREMDVTDQFAAVGLEYERAVDLAEKLGKRLPDEWEYEFAATSGGTRAFSWGDSPELLRNWVGEIGPVGEPAWDQVQAKDHEGNPVPVFGLCTNVAEWTDSWADSLPTIDGNQSDLPSRFRVVRGGAPTVMDRQPDPSGIAHDPRLRHIVERKKFDRPGLGFRCARSAKPRLTPDDWRP